LGKLRFGMAVAVAFGTFLRAGDAVAQCGSPAAIWPVGSGCSMLSYCAEHAKRSMGANCAPIARRIIEHLDVQAYPPIMDCLYKRRCCFSPAAVLWSGGDV